MQAEPGNGHLRISPEVQQALRDGRAVVALESTILCHGMPPPKNVQTALKVEQTVREQGAIPATIAIIGGQLKVGLNESEINYLGNKGQQVIKTSRRDIPMVVATKADGATTVAATMIIATMAGIDVFATGGIGGVHRNVGETMDISADLEELSKSSVAVVCAGVKSILDIGRTLEYLETHGVPVIGYQTNTFPAFFIPDSGFQVDYRFDTAEDIANALRIKWQLQLKGGAVIANPIAKAHALDPGKIERVIESALTEMNQRGITGKASTPFLLAKVAELTGGDSLQANIHLVLSNAELAGRIAVAMQGQ